MDAKDYKAQRWLRRFSPLLEREFDDTHSQRSHARIVESSWVGIACTIFIVVYQRLFIPQGLPPLTVALGICIGAGVVVAALIVATRSSSLRRQIEPIATPIAWSLIVSVVTLPCIDLPPDRRAATFGLPMLFLGFLYTLYRGRFYNTIVCGATMTSTFLAFAWAYDFYSDERFLQVQMYLIGFNILGLGVCFFMERGDRVLYLMNREVEFERARAEKLLQSMLPASIAEKLKFGNEAIAESHADATVLFADLVGFTPLAETMPPSRLVQVLGELFGAYDAVADEHGLEKIKTIGDSYMAAAGVPLACVDHAERCARGAIGLRAATDAFRERTGFAIHVRIGLHSGPLVGGVIGAKKPAYDIWGPTVNLASRMESHGVTDEIQISAATRDRLGDGFRVSSATKIAVKGVGEVTAFFLEPRPRVKAVG